VNQQPPHSWLQVGELTAGFGGNELTPSQALAGRRLQANLEEGSRFELVFRPDEQLEINILADGPAARSVGKRVVAYRATSLRENVLFVDSVLPDQPPRSLTWILDLNSGWGTAVLGRLPLRAETEESIYARASSGKELTTVAVDLLPLRLGDQDTKKPGKHAPTTELIGRRIRYVYGPRDVYEHIYLNERFYTWQCLKGPEIGLADTDRCHYIKIAGDLYLFIWREKIVPTLGMVLIDIAAARSTGKIFGYHGGDFGEITNASVGASAQLMNVTPGYP